MVEHQLRKLSKNARLIVNVTVTREYKLRYWFFRKLIYFAVWLACRVMDMGLEYKESNA